MSENSSQGNGTLVRVDNVQKNYRRGSEDVLVLANLSLEVRNGEFLAKFGSVTLNMRLHLYCVLPLEVLKDLCGLEREGHCEILWVMELLPVPFVTESNY